MGHDCGTGLESVKAEECVQAWGTAVSAHSYEVSLVTSPYLPEPSIPDFLILCFMLEKSK